MKKATRKLIRRAAAYISADAENNFESNADPDKWVDSRAAWRDIKRARKLAKELAALAKAAA